jgi:hypothetical protein
MKIFRRLIKKLATAIENLIFNFQVATIENIFTKISFQTKFIEENFMKLRVAAAADFNNNIPFCFMLAVHSHKYKLSCWSFSIFMLLFPLLSTLLLLFFYKQR